MSLESITQQIREEIEKLNQVLHLLERGAKKTTRAKARRKMSAAGRRRIAAAHLQTRGALAVLPAEITRQFA